MGKKKIAVVGKKTIKKEKRTTVRTGKEHGRLADVGAQALAEAAIIEEKEKKLEKEVLAKVTKTVKKSGLPRAKSRGARYLQARQKVDQNQFYPLPEAIKLLKSVSISRFNGSVDVHLNVSETGIRGEVEFPHPTGKKQKIRVADEELLGELTKGKINFTTLVASPKMMPKLVKFAKLLGPRGLMPNPKTGTISDKPEELVKKLASKTQFRTEDKAPLIHLTIGKVDFPEKDLEKNFRALVEVIGRQKITKAVITPSMGPAIKIALD